MKKYKLIKKYPGSPKLGTEEMFHVEYIKKYSEFWEEVVEKDYEIVLVKHPTGLQENPGPHNLNRLLKECAIHSIKRLSDGEVFTVGDFLDRPSHYNHIKRIELTNSKYKIRLWLGSKTNKQEISGLLLNNAKKAKKPLFTTEDGVDIFEGDKVYEITRGSSIFPYDSWEAHYGSKGIPLPGKMMFSTKEAAEQHILMNKPCLSINDILDSYFLSKNGDWVKNLKEKVRSKY